MFVGCWGICRGVFSPQCLWRSENSSRHWPFSTRLRQNFFYLLLYTRIAVLWASSKPPVSGFHLHRSVIELSRLVLLSQHLNGFWGSKLIILGWHSKHFSHWAIFPALYKSLKYHLELLLFSPILFLRIKKNIFQNTHVVRGRGYYWL